MKSQHNFAEIAIPISGGSGSQSIGYNGSGTQGWKKINEDSI